MCPELVLFVKLLFGHAVADFGLQSSAMAAGKRGGGAVPPGQKPAVAWPYWLTAHALIHGAAVYTVTGSVTWGLFNTVCHGGLDWMKTRYYTDVHVDQTLHLVTLATIAVGAILVPLP